MEDEPALPDLHVSTVVLCKCVSKRDTLGDELIILFWRPDEFGGALALKARPQIIGSVCKRASKE